MCLRMPRLPPVENHTTTRGGHKDQKAHPWYPDSPMLPASHYDRDSRREGI